jgi:glycosyltransferase involved in cell wall biosynthesis
MKLIIQSVIRTRKDSRQALKELRASKGLHEVEWLNINDGSTDNTVEIARKSAWTISSDSPHHGLARGLCWGWTPACPWAPTSNVYTDADNQYDARDIPTWKNPNGGQGRYREGRGPSPRSRLLAIKKYLQKPEARGAHGEPHRHPRRAVGLPAR